MRVLQLKIKRGLLCFSQPFCRFKRLRDLVRLGAVGLLFGPLPFGEAMVNIVELQSSSASFTLKQGFCIGRC